MGAQQHDTPKKARVKGAIEFLEYHGLPYKKEEVFEFFDVSRPAGYKLLHEEST
ncbi:hypothetical protein BHE90_017048, partial [Fusarium euwallaceae]